MAAHDIKSTRRPTVAGPQNQTGNCSQVPELNMSERRNQERMEVSLEAVWDGHGNRPVRITDLSEGGCYVDTTGESCVGEQLTLRVRMPDGAWLELTGEVAHHQVPVGFGLRFSALTDDQREQLLSFIEYLKTPHDGVTALLQ
jgi:hypothetical protein